MSLTSIGGMMPSPVAVYGAVLVAWVGGAVLAQATIPGNGLAVSTGQGIVLASAITAVITALGTAILQPYFKERGTQTRYDESMKRLADAEARIAELEKLRRDADTNEKRMIERLGDLTEKNLRLAHLLLVAGGRLRQGDAPLVSLLVSDKGPTASGPRVLVVEDSPQAREPMEIMLETAGFAVEAVATLADGIEALSRNPAAIVLDLMLPDGDGIEILRRVRQEKRDTRVVITTGKVEEQLGPVRALAPAAVLRKPFDFASELLPALRGPSS